MPETLVTVASYNLHVDAIMARSRLDSEGIESMLLDENIVRMDWFYANLVGGIKLQVRPEDAPAAREILGLPPVGEKDSEEFSLCCPRCKSEKVRFREWHRRLHWIAFLVLFLPLPLGKRFECED